MILAILCALVLAWHLRTDTDGQRRLGSTLSAWIFVGLLQGAVGYTQYFTGVPELLVGVHIALATFFWIVTVRLVDLAFAMQVRRSSRPSSVRVSASV